jgi:hypothetical protein
MNNLDLYNFILKQHLHSFISLLVDFTHFFNYIRIFFRANQIWDLAHAQQVIQIFKINVTLVLEAK